MKTKTKLVYGIAGLLGFLPLAILVFVQSLFALDSGYDVKLVIDANETTMINMVAYDNYNALITDLYVRDEDSKPLLFTVIEATNEYAIIDFHGAEVNDVDIGILGIQFITDNNTKSEMLQGIVYLRYKNVITDESDPNYARDAWIREFANTMRILYKAYFEQPVGTIPYLWLKIIGASIGTILGLVTVLLVILRKSTKALVKRYWRIAVLVGLAEGTIILGLITWIVSDMFQVFASATIGWLLFLGFEKFAKSKGYLESSISTNTLPTPTAVGELPPEVQLSIDQIVARFKR